MRLLGSWQSFVLQVELFGDVYSRSVVRGLSGDSRGYILLEGQLELLND